MSASLPAPGDTAGPAASPSISAPAPASSRTPRVAVEHIRALFTQTPATLAGNAMGVGLMVAIFHSLANPWPLSLWITAALGMLSLRLAHYLRFRRTPNASATQLFRWRRSWAALVLGQGALWGAAVWLFWGMGTPYHHLALVLIVYAYCLGSVQMLATQRFVFLAFLNVVLTPTIVRIASDTSQPWHLQLAVILTVLFVITVLMARTYSSALGQAVGLKARTDELAVRLREEMLAAEAARRAAEAANRAKTQFFAAASHDLRQPLHAMGLFAEALRQRSHDPEVLPLVNSINESVDALEGLFGELLDITRIDTGGVDCHPQAVPLKDLFNRLRLHFEPQAFEKGLALTFRGERHVAHTDALLLERVLRNLVSNAIRYSDDGGVLVAARQRGDRLLVQVWDSGIGIAAASLPRIWDEFFQVSSNRPLQAHHRKGLGLGLAIVKRLADLMGAPITVQSRPGHGTVFSLLVPLGKAPPQTPEAPSAGLSKLALGLTLQGRTIAVVEDEPAVREGLLVLLQAWGAQVADFDSVEAFEAWLASPQARRPDLQLVDYRLPQGRTGLEALEALRVRWPDAPVPSVVITGSSLAGLETEAGRLGYHLLMKPVLPNKLRAMIAFKLGVRPARETLNP